MAIDQFLDIEQVSASKYPKESSVISVFLRLKIKNKKKSPFGEFMPVSTKNLRTVYSVQETLVNFFPHMP